MRHRPNFRFLARILIALVIGAALFAASAFTQQSTQERAVWDVQISRTLKNPEKRAVVIAWIERQTGRALPLNPDSYGRERG